MMSMSGSLVLVVGLVFSVSETVLGAVVCGRDNEGKIVARGCWGYAKCVDGKVDVTSCEPGYAFDTVSRKCVDQVGRTADCGLCEGKKDGAYADHLQDCKSFFVCTAGFASEEQDCDYRMVYDEKTMRCNLPMLVLPPCGTRGE